ncbi:hypothetical protein MSPP1_001408 [Malassezia sp. CBS 17886]|nr:hypothetical protein MSPP1_001408 [Malassezia sp. CBS 17886]
MSSVDARGVVPAAPRPPPKGKKTNSAPSYASKLSRPDTRRRPRASQYVEPEVVTTDGVDANVATRIDVIDQLDISGLLGSTMFHHDSPYDACSPHSNQSNNKTAPILAFDPSGDTAATDPRGGRTAQASTGAKGKAGRRNDALDRRRLFVEHEGGLSSQNSLGLDPQYDAANPNAEFFGVAAEPWHEFATPSRRRTTPLESESTNQQNNAISNYADMETVLRGGTYSADPAPNAKAHDTPSLSMLARPAADTSETRQDARYASPNTKPQRSKSLLGRLRRVRIAEQPEANAPLPQPPPINGKSRDATADAALWDGFPGSTGSGRRQYYSAANQSEPYSYADAAGAPPPARTVSARAPSLKRSKTFLARLAGRNRGTN